MPQSLSQIYLHIVFSTKNRTMYLQDEHLRAKTHAYLAGICKNLESPALIVGGVADHAHVLCRFSKNITVVAFLRELQPFQGCGSRDGFFPGCAAATLGCVMKPLRGKAGLFRQ